MELFFEKLACWSLAAALIWVALRLLREKDKEKPFYATLISLVAVGAALYPMSAVQGLLKTEVISIVKHTLKSYGDKLDDFQNTMTNMEGELSGQQRQLQKQQKELEFVQTNILISQSNILAEQKDIAIQYNQITNMQDGLVDAQTNIYVQQKKIEDVEFLVRNFFDKMQIEVISAEDSNRVSVVDLSNGVYHVFIRLQSVPIARSVQGLVQGSLQQYPLTPMNANIGNIGMWYFRGFDRRARFTLQYVRDSRATNVFQRLEFRDNNVWLDGMPLKLFE